MAKASLFVNYYTQPSQRGWVLASYFLWDVIMTGRKTRALQVPAVVPYKAFKNFPKALYGTTGGTCSARVFRPVLFHSISWNIPLVTLFSWYTNGPLIVHAYQPGMTNTHVNYQLAQCKHERAQAPITSGSQICYLRQRSES